MNLVELMDNAKKVADWRGTGYSQNQSWNLTNAIPYMGTKSILYQAKCFGQTEAVEHVVNFQFLGLRIYDKPIENTDMMKLTYKDIDYYCEWPTVHTEVKVRCSCSDWYHRSSYWCWKEKCIFGGKPKAYKRKTKNHKPVNPLKLPFICKHQWQLQAYLRTENYMK